MKTRTLILSLGAASLMVGGSAMAATHPAATTSSMGTAASAPAKQTSNLVHKKAAKTPAKTPAKAPAKSKAPKS